MFREGTVFDNITDSISLPPEPRDFAMGDLNNDGHQDIIIVFNGSYIWIFNGTASGDLDPHPWIISLTPLAISDVRSVALGDIDKDGLTDFAISYGSPSPGICIFYQRTHFSVSSSVTIATMYSPYQLLIGNLSQDTNDLSSAENNSVVAIVEPKSPNSVVELFRYPFGAENYARFFVSGFTNAQIISAGFLNGDNKLDLFVANMGNRDGYVFEQPAGSWSFVDNLLYPWVSQKIIISGQIIDAKIANISGSGLRDLLLVNSNNNKAEVYFNNGTGLNGGAYLGVQASSGVRSVAVGNISNHANPDLYITNGVGSNCSIYYRTDANGFNPTPDQTFPTDKTPLKSIVRDNDLPKPGLYVLTNGRSGQNGSLEIHYSRELNVTTAQKDLVLSGATPGSITGGSLRGHASTLAALLPTTNQMLLFDVSSGAKRYLSTGTTPSQVVFGDFNGDGFNDIAVLNGAGTISVYNGSVDLFTKSAPDFTMTAGDLGLSSPSSICAARVLTGSALQYLVVGCDGGLVVVYYADGPSPTYERVTSAGAGNRSVVVSGKFNLAGQGADIAALNKEGGYVEVYYRSTSGAPGSYYSTVLTLDKASYTGSSLMAGDFNGDGMTDLAMGTTSSDILFYNQSVSDGGFRDDQVLQWRLGLPFAPSHVSSGDLNDDGRCDLLISSNDRPIVRAYLSKAGVGFVNSFDFVSGGPATALYVGDLNGDGRNDTACSASDSYSLGMWFQNDLVPKAAFTMDGVAVDNKTIVEGQSIIFDASPSTDSYSDRSSLLYDWDFFGDGSQTNTSKNVTFKYQLSRPNVYAGTLTVTDLGGLSNTTRFWITVTDIDPVASFTYQPTNQTENRTVAFFDRSTNYTLDPITYHWDFGDGNRSEEKNPAHRYMYRGTYTVTLTVTSTMDDASSTYSDTVNITDLGPTAIIRTSSNYIDEGGSVTFYSDSTSEVDPIVSYQWDFHDRGIVNTTKDAVHEFPNKGIYDVTLTVWDNDTNSSTARVTIYVNETLPVSSFTPSVLNPLEGQTVTFTDRSHAYDGIRSWSWDFGDGSTSTDASTSHAYPTPGTYVVTLTVVDNDDVSNETTATIVVQPSDPITTPLVAGGSEFNMDQEITFRESAQQLFVPITRYAWDFDYNPTYGFNETAGRSLNTTAWSYNAPGEYTICVRVWDANSFSQRTLTIAIKDVQPVANITVQSLSEQRGFNFDASKSWDTPSDNASLMFRWNFADGTGWSSWSSEKNVQHNFTADGTYSVVVEVLDQWSQRGTMTYSLLVDTDGPSIDLASSIITQAYQGDEFLVKVNVTDPSGVANVTLFYTIANHTYAIPMSRDSGTDIFVASIPALNATGPFSYHIEAVDNGGHAASSTPISLSVLDRPDDTWLYLAAAAMIAVLLLLFLYFRNAAMVVDEVFIIYRDGNLLAHQTRRLKPGMDDQILGSMLVAIQNFVKDSFKDESSTGLNRMDFGEKKVLVEKGDHIYLAVVLQGKREGKVPQRMRESIVRAESDFKDSLEDWDGDLEKVRGIKDTTVPLLKGRIKDVLPHQEKGPPSKPEAPEARPAAGAICPVCGAAVDIDSEKCPHCDADLALAGLDELVDLADQISNDRK